MSVDERTRHEIHGRFEELLGPELAGAFMSCLPPVGWAGVATKRDLEAQGFRLEAAIHREVGSLRAEMTERIDRAIRLNVFTNIATMVTLTGLVLVVTRLGRSAVATPARGAGTPPSAPGSRGCRGSSGRPCSRSRRRPRPPG